MKKSIMIFIFIFLAGLFSGMFYSMSLSEESCGTLSALLLEASSVSAAGFFHDFLFYLRTSLFMLMVMIPAVFCRFLCPLPGCILWFKSFTVGFCCGLLYISDPGRAFSLSLVRIFPKELFMLPSFIAAAVLITYLSLSNGSRKRNRVSISMETLKYPAAAILAAVIAGSLAGAIFGRIPV